MVDINNYQKYKQTLIMLHNNNLAIRIIKNNYTLYNHISHLQNLRIDDAYFFLDYDVKKQIISYCLDDMFSYVFDIICDICEKRRMVNPFSKKDDLINDVMYFHNSLDDLLSHLSNYQLPSILLHPAHYLIEKFCNRAYRLKKTITNDSELILHSFFENIH